MHYSTSAQDAIGGRTEGNSKIDKTFLIVVPHLGKLRIATIYDLDDEIRITPLTRKHLDTIDKWPPFTQWDLRWANFSNTGKYQKDAWFRNNQGGKKLWFACEVPNMSWENPTIIGRISLIEPESGGDFILGIVIHPDFIGRGYGTRYTQLLLRAVADLTDADGIWLETFYRNERAMRVYEKLGFEKLGYSYHRGIGAGHDRYYIYQIPRNRMSQMPDVHVLLKTKI